jgi:hypothetical protein
MCVTGVQVMVTTLVELEGRLFSFDYNPSTQTIESFCSDKCKSMAPYLELLTFSGCLADTMEILESVVLSGDNSVSTYDNTEK